MQVVGRGDQRREGDAVDREGDGDLPHGEMPGGSQPAPVVPQDGRGVSPLRVVSGEAAHFPLSNPVFRWDAILSAVLLIPPPKLPARRFFVPYLLIPFRVVRPRPDPADVAVKHPRECYVVESSEAVEGTIDPRGGDKMKGGTMRSNARRLTLWIALTLLAAVPAGAADVRYAVPVGDSPSIGPANAPVTIVEFLDYQ